MLAQEMKTASMICPFDEVDERLVIIIALIANQGEMGIDVAIENALCRSYEDIVTFDRIVTRDKTDQLSSTIQPYAGAHNGAGTCVWSKQRRVEPVRNYSPPIGSVAEV